MTSLPKRKHTRLPGYDYSTPGAYFVTICTQNRKCILSEITVGAVPNAVSGFKRLVNRELGQNIWQRSFHDHIIRGDADYREIWEYIENNPARWREDCFFPDEG